MKLLTIYLDELMKTIIQKLARGENLTPEEMQFAIKAMLNAESSPAATAAFLTALMIKGETQEEICTAAKFVRLLSLNVSHSFDEPVVDITGTGSSHSNMFNISTASAIIASAAGIKIAKHGNIAINDSSGSADVLKLAGIKLELSAQAVLDSITECNFVFMYSPQFHSALKFVDPVRKSIGIKTIFNLIYPLCNPCGVKHQVLGVSNPKWVKPLAEVGTKLGYKHMLVVSSATGLDEISAVRISSVCEMKEDGLFEYTINPKDYGMNYESSQEIMVLNPQQSLDLILKIFKNEENGIGKDVLALNAAAIFLVAEKNIYFKDGIELAKKTIESGAALQQLDKIIATSKKLA